MVAATAAPAAKGNKPTREANDCLAVIRASKSAISRLKTEDVFLPFGAELIDWSFTIAGRLWRNPADNVNPWPEKLKGLAEGRICGPCDSGLRQQIDDCASGSDKTGADQKRIPEGFAFQLCFLG